MSQPHHDIARDLGAAVAKTAPPVAVWSMTLNDWLAAVSILYVVAQFAYLLWKWRRDIRSGRKGQARK